MKTENWINRHLKEIVLTSIMITIAVILWVIAMTLDLCPVQGPSMTFKLCGLAENFSYAILVSLLVRWTIVWFENVRPVDDIYGTTNANLNAAIKNAKQRIWILDFWLKDGDAAKILNTGANDIKLIAASFEPESPIFARLNSRKIDVEDAKSALYTSISRFVDKGKTNLVQFYSHHWPAFVYVLDKEVFWGPFPIDVDSHVYDRLIHRDDISNKTGEFWEKQFDCAWKESHSFKDERKYNKRFP